MRAATTRDSLHTLAMNAEYLCVRCQTCEHRAVLGPSVLKASQGDMTPIHTLKLRCIRCGATAGMDFFIPLTVEEAEAFLQGRDVPGTPG